MKKSTTDIYLAAAFLSLGSKLKNINRENPKHMEFEFETHDPTPPMNETPIRQIKIQEPSVTPLKSDPILDLNAVETQWANGTLMVEATSYAEAIRRMKSLVHSKS